MVLYGLHSHCLLEGIKKVKLPDSQKVLAVLMWLKVLKMLLPKLTVERDPSDMPENVIISAICEEDEQLKQLVESGKTLEVMKFWGMKNSACDMHLQKKCY